MPHYKDPDADILKFINNDPLIVNWPGFRDLEILRFPLIPGDLDSIGIDIYPLVNTVDSKVKGLVLVLGFDPAKKEFAIRRKPWARRPRPGDVGFLEDAIERKGSAS